MGPALTTLGGRGVTPRKMLCYAPTEVSSTPDSPQNQCGPYFKINVTFTRTSRILSSMNLSARLFSIENLHLNVFGNIFLNKVTPQIRKIFPPAAANILLIKIFQHRPESAKIERVYTPFSFFKLRLTQFIFIFIIWRSLNSCRSLKKGISHRRKP